MPNWYKVLLINEFADHCSILYSHNVSGTMAHSPSGSGVLLIENWYTSRMSYWKCRACTYLERLLSMYISNPLLLSDVNLKMLGKPWVGDTLKSIENDILY